MPGTSDSSVVSSISNEIPDDVYRAVQELVTETVADAEPFSSKTAALTTLVNTEIIQANRNSVDQTNTDERQRLQDAWDLVTTGFDSTITSLTTTFDNAVTALDTSKEALDLAQAAYNEYTLYAVNNRTDRSTDLLSAASQLDKDTLAHKILVLSNDDVWDAEANRRLTDLNNKQNTYD